MSSCNICLEQFDSDGNRPVVGFCGHTLCFMCTEKLGVECPTCRDKSFRHPVTNYQLLELIKENSCNVFANYALMKNKLEKLLQETKEKLGEMHETLEKKSTFARLSLFNQKREEFKEEIEEKVMLAFECWEKLKKKNKIVQEAMKSLNSEHEKLEGEVKKVLPEAVFKCHTCKHVLPKDTTSSDVIRIRCPNCCWYNSIGKFKEGHKWAFMCCWISSYYDMHDQLFPVEKIGKEGKCQICGKNGHIYENVDPAAWEPDTSSLFH